MLTIADTTILPDVSAIINMFPASVAELNGKEKFCLTIKTKLNETVTEFTTDFVAYKKLGGKEIFIIHATGDRDKRELFEQTIWKIASEVFKKEKSFIILRNYKINDSNKDNWLELPERAMRIIVAEKIRLKKLLGIVRNAFPSELIALTNKSLEKTLPVDTRDFISLDPHIGNKKIEDIAIEDVISVQELASESTQTCKVYNFSVAIPDITNGFTRRFLKRLAPANRRFFQKNICFHQNESTPYRPAWIFNFRMSVTLDETSSQPNTESFEFRFLSLEKKLIKTKENFHSFSKQDDFNKIFIDLFNINSGNITIDNFLNLYMKETTKYCLKLLLDCKRIKRVPIIKSFKDTNNLDLKVLWAITTGVSGCQELQKIKKARDNTVVVSMDKSEVTQDNRVAIKPFSTGGRETQCLLNIVISRVGNFDLSQNSLS